MLPAENGCCNLKPILIHRNDIKVERGGARARERGKREEDQGENERRQRENVSLRAFPERRIKRERGDPGVGCCKRRATPSHGGRVSPCIFISNIAHIQSSARDGQKDRRRHQCDTNPAPCTVITIGAQQFIRLSGIKTPLRSLESTAYTPFPICSCHYVINVKTCGPRALRGLAPSTFFSWGREGG